MPNQPHRAIAYVVPSGVFVSNLGGGGSTTAILATQASPIFSKVPPNINGVYAKSVAPSWPAIGSCTLEMLPKGCYCRGAASN